MSESHRKSTKLPARSCQPLFSRKPTKFSRSQPSYSEPTPEPTRIRRKERESQNRDESHLDAASCRPQASSPISSSSLRTDGSDNELPTEEHDAESNAAFMRWGTTGKRPAPASFPERPTVKKRSFVLLNDNLPSIPTQSVLPSTSPVGSRSSDSDLGNPPTLAFKTLSGRPRRALAALNLKGDENTVFCLAADAIREATWFFDPFIEPAAYAAYIERVWNNRCLDCNTNVPLRPDILRTLKQRGSSARSYMAADISHFVRKIYGLDGLQPTEVEARVAYLLENDRYICHPNKYEVCGWRFAAPQIDTLVALKFFNSNRQRGFQDPEFVSKINHRFFALVATTLWYILQGWKTGVWIKLPEFRPRYCEATYIRHCNTWKKLPEANSKKLVSDLQRRMNKKLSGYTGLSEKETEGYDDPAADDFLDYQAGSEDKIQQEKNEVRQGKDVRSPKLGEEGARNRADREDGERE